MSGHYMVGSSQVRSCPVTSGEFRACSDHVSSIQNKVKSGKVQLESCQSKAVSGHVCSR